MPGEAKVIMQGTADRVFQYRALIPWTIGLMKKFVFSAEDSDFTAHLFRYSEVLFTFLALVAFRYFVSLFVRNVALSCILSFLLYLVLPFNFLFPSHDLPIRYPWFMKGIMFFPNSTALYYPYDMPSIFFFTLGMILIYQRRTVPYYILFAVATFNRETTCFLTFIYVFTQFGKGRFRSVALHAGAQFVIWIAIKAFLFKTFAANPGETVQTAWKINLKHIVDPTMYYYLFSSTGYLVLPAILLSPLIPNLFVKRSLFVIIPIFVLVIFFGQLAELRDYSELLPVVVAALIVEIKELFMRMALAAEDPSGGEDATGIEG
jgi:hypothetical protein